MAQALTDERVQTLRWEAEATDLATTLDQLHRLEAKMREEAAKAGEHPGPRNSVLNLIVVLSGHHRETACDRMIGDLAPSHPLRAILIHPGGGHGPGTLDAQLTVDAHHLVRGACVQREQVMLHVRGAAATHLASLVEPLLVPDVPTYLWWWADVDKGAEGLSSGLELADVLLVDSAQVAHPVPLLEELLLAAQRVVVTDLRWWRLRPWRDAMAQCFAMADRRPLLSGIREVELEAAGPALQQRVGPALLAGWLASALSWNVTSVAAVGNATTEAYAEPPAGGRVRILLRPASRPVPRTREVTALRLSGEASGRSFRFEVELEAHDAARVVIDLGDERPVEQMRSVPDSSHTSLVSQVFWSTARDTVFEAALGAAMPLLRAL